MKRLLRDPKIKAKVDKLLAQMTLEQKIGQMIQVERLSCTPDEVKHYHLGSVFSGAGSAPDDNSPQGWTEMLDQYWLASTEKDEQHLGVPILYGVDAIHGHNNVKGATIFPHNIGLGAADDPSLVGHIAAVTSIEVLATGVDWVFAPNLAVAQDPHWGRTYESFSESPQIAVKYAERIISGFHKGFNEIGVLTCVKHWVGDGGTSHGIDHGNTLLDFADLKNTHMQPYYAALEAGALTVMASFSSWNGNKCHGNRALLTDMLKGEMQFQGFILSDMDGIDYLSDDFYTCVETAVNAGIDMFMLTNHWQMFIEHLKSHVELGRVPMSRIDDAVRRILSVKVKAGVFEKVQPSLRVGANSGNFGSFAHREVAREAVRKSMVLLKNDANMLPLNKSSRILVAGKNAHNRGNQCGGFTLDWQGRTGNSAIEGGSSIWDGIKAVAPNATLISSLDELNDTQEQDLDKYEVAILVIGEQPYAEGVGDIRESDEIIVEMGSQIDGQINLLQPYGKSLELAKLHPEDGELIRRFEAQGISVVTVLVSGRPLIINPELNSSNAFIAAWLPGSEGQGVSDLIFGDDNFSGKLSFTWPKQLKTLNTDSTALFPVGFGLKY
ncbi:glycoside hydrolase family 3 protein [Shewanella woodyi]|uniref:glycoside hydrolase family 3 protein n=1 Tax=Shewanella woodyi TaxID=60961 RepID=UPI00374A0CD8